MVILLTFFGLLVAIYAIVPRYRQLELDLKLGWYSWSVIIVGFLCGLCLEFYDFFEAKVGTIIPWSWPYGVTPEKAINIVILALIVFLALRIRFAGLTRRNIFKFQNLIEELIWDGHYTELFLLFQRHLPKLFKIYHANFLFSRIRKYLAPPLWQEARLLLKTEDQATSPGMFSRIKRFLRPTFRGVSVLFPRYEAEQNSAHEIIREILLSPACVEVLSRTRPYLGIQILQLWADRFERSDFFNLFMKALLHNTESIFYTELANTQNVSSFDRYHLSESNRLLHYLFSNSQIAKELDAYKPVGDFVLKDLDRLVLDPTADTYNRVMRDFEDDAWKSPLVASIHFFEIMVIEALYQGIEWHMWLYYLPDMVERMVRNYKPSDPRFDPSAEWPIRYSCLIYRIFSSLRNFIKAVEDIPADQTNVQLKSTSADHQNDNIPKSSLLALGDCVWIILAADVLGEKFQNYLLDIVFRIYFDLRSLKTFDNYATALVNSVIHGGSYSSRQNDRSYRVRLFNGFENLKSEYFIKFQREHVLELEGSLRT